VTEPFEPVGDAAAGRTARRHGIAWHRLLAEPARPEWIRRRPGAPWLVVATVCIGAFMGQLDASIVTLAVPNIQRDLRAPLSSVEWVALVYLLVLVGTVSAVGRVADMVGRKLLYTYGFGVFTAASLGCALAPNMGWLIAARIVQAIGAAMLQANSVALIRTSMPANKLGKAIGLQGAAQAIGLALGPTIGGLLIGLGGWRWIFYVNVPAGTVGFLLGWLLLPRTQVFAPRSRFDWPGVLLIMPTIATMLLAFSQAASLGFTNPFVLGMLVASFLLGLAFVTHERNSRSPLLDLSLFRARHFSLGLVSGLLSYLVLFGVLLVTPLFLETTYHMRPGQAGLMMTILPFTLALMAPLAGMIVDRWGTRLLTATGMALAATGLFVLVLATPTISLIAVALSIMGLGLGLFIPANNSIIAASGHGHQAGMVSGVLNMTRGIGTSLGVAVAGAAYALASGARNFGILSPAGASHGLHAAAIVLALCAVLAAGFSALKGRL
jgi:EmrB/QacA subfamily drug resistance transporter